MKFKSFYWPNLNDFDMIASRQEKIQKEKARLKHEGRRADQKKIENSG